MEDYSQVNIKPLTRKAINKLKSGKSIRILPGDVPVHYSASKIKKIVSKFSKGKGMNMNMTADEIAMNGEGIFKSISRGVKSVGKTISRGTRRLAGHATDYLKSEQFKKDLVNVARPTVKGLVDAGISTAAASAIAAQPELAPLIVPAAYAASYGANKLIDKPSYVTGDKKYDKGNGIIMPMKRLLKPRIRRPKPMGSDPITYTPKDLVKDAKEYVGKGIYAGHQTGYGIYAGRGMGEGIYAGSGLMGGRNQLQAVLASPDPLFSQHHNQMMRQFM